MTLEKQTRRQELLCINTEKVYDWILNEATFELMVDGLELPVNPVTGVQLECDDIDQSAVTCTVTPAEVDPIIVLDREDQEFIIDGGEEIKLQIINIRKNFDVNVFVPLIAELGGRMIEVGSAFFTKCEQVILCAPDGTDIDVTYTDLDCFVCAVNCDMGSSTEIDELNVTVSVKICQSIQSTFDVTLELVADLCQPRDILPFPPCPPPIMPAQCPVIFPVSDPCIPEKPIGKFPFKLELNQPIDIEVELQNDEEENGQEGEE
ncbi:hypothetical protein JCM21714_1699 [Gracilibacillus boraciitolerans JCM 21714]|uniref:Uncharacterized protein n=1 Tax=Gracilibacillus boraciitolerans JCM 21714 TaxID=1298598 RepID=W4VIP4_9BACI|nr:hypothetical protein [Gracilibacillus boraciitolerans]GAE92688.1 hypothetical protein JCM21714_1699 [Gracilibacillus boraciitolerans JCM 21714]